MMLVNKPDVQDGKWTYTTTIKRIDDIEVYLVVKTNGAKRFAMTAKKKYWNLAMAYLSHKNNIKSYKIYKQELLR